MEYLKSHSDLFEHLYEKVGDAKEIIRKKTLQIFVMICEQMNTQCFNYVTKAATNYARRLNKSPMAELVNSLNSKWDKETRFFAL